MLLHTLPTEPQGAGKASRLRPAVDFRAVPRVSVWSWLGPVAGGEAAITLLVPAGILLVASGWHSLPLQVPAVSLASLALWFMAAQSQQLYRPLHGHHAFSSGPLATACLLWVLAVTVLLLALRPDIPIPTTICALATGMLLAIAARQFWQARLQARLVDGSCIDRALVMATDRGTAREAADELEEASGNRIRAAVCMPIPGTNDGPSLAWLEDAVCSRMVDQVYIVGVQNLAVVFSEVLPHLAGLDIDVTLLSERSAKATAPSCSTRMGRLNAVPLSSRAMGPVRASAKRAMDLALASVICLLGAPLLALIALAIKLDSPGPVLFVQRREGLRCRVFRVFKFRTMFTHLADEAALDQTTRHDRRVTPVGRILRRLSLDELPQLINVLRGDMSIVGPRPHSLGMTVDGRSLHDTLAEYRIRHRVKPGITGWAQINGCRGEVTTIGKLQRRIALDCEYIERCSVAMDGWILLRTITTMLFDKHAY